MIVKMKKTHLVVLHSERENSLEKLREIGVMHLDLSNLPPDHTSELYEKRKTIKGAMEILPKVEEKEPLTSQVSIDDAIHVSGEIIDIYEKSKVCSETVKSLTKEYELILPWGDYDPQGFLDLQSRGVDIRLYELTKDQLKDIPETVKIFTIHKTKMLSRVAAVILDYKDEPHFEEFSLPERSLATVEKELTEEKEELLDIHNRLNHFAKEKIPLLNQALTQLEELIEFDDASTAMEEDAKIAFITGYVPLKKVDPLKESAAQNSWGLMITDPGEEDQVPTLVENLKPVKAINPVFGLLGTVPGYKEFDISIWFLLFFSVFWAMILGDAGYGALFLIFTIVGRLLFRKASFEPFLLLFVTSLTTIAWGAVTGNWFGVEAFARHDLLSWMIIPEISSFAEEMSNDGDKIIMHMCFIIGAVHLTIAHIVTLFRLLPSLKSIAELGWLSILWGLFFIIRTLVLKFDANPYAIWLILGGLVCIILFSEQEGNFFKGVAKGLANLILIALGGIGFFSDIVSYVRLFAVGLATLEVAKSFNTMAGGLGFEFPGIIGVALILFFGHGLNIVLGCMSLIVHGVRLNMLEFSGHLNMEWSGFAYKPFKKNAVG